MNAQKRKTILLVEDEAAIATDEAKALKRYGFKIIIVQTGEKAIEAIQTYPEIDLVLMGIDLGSEMDGIRAAEIILQQREIPLIFLSSHTEREVLEKIEGLTSYGYVVKNSGETVLIASIKMAFRLFEARLKEWQNEAALRNNEEKLKLAQSIAKLGEWSWNIASDRAEWSDQTYKIFQAPRKEGSYQLVKSFVHPDDLDLWQKTIQQAIKKKEPFSIDFRVIRSDGETIWVHDETRTVFNEQGELVGYKGTVQDITERKRAEESLRKTQQQLQLIFNAVPAIIWQKDREGKYVAVNKALCHASGLSEEDILGKTDHELLPAVIADKFVRDDRRILSSGTPESGIEEPYQKASGEYGWIRTDKMVYYDEDGNVAGTIGFALDITERKQAEEELKKSKDRLRALSAHIQSVREEERANISREIHDDLGQQLTGLKLDLAWLSSHLNPDQSKLKEKARTMAQLIDHTVRTIRRISTELRPRILDDFGLVAALEWQAQEFANKTGITCSFRSTVQKLDLKADLSIGVFRIFQEALTNIARHSRATRVQASLQNDPKGLVLTIRDNGQGISEQEVDRSTSLGLVGMRERALIIGGTVTIQGKKGKGTSVILRLPAAKE